MNEVMILCTVASLPSPSFDPDNDELNCTWNFGDGTNAHGMFVEHLYTPGRYTMVLTVSDGELTDKIKAVVEVVE